MSMVDRQEIVMDDDKDAEIKRLREIVNFLLDTIHEAGDLLDDGELTDASNKLDVAKFKYDHIQEK